MPRGKVREESISRAGQNTTASHLAVKDTNAKGISKPVSKVKTQVKKKISKATSNVKFEENEIIEPSTNVDSRVNVIRKVAPRTDFVVKSKTKIASKVDSRVNNVNRKVSQLDARNEISTVESSNDAINRKALKVKSGNTAIDRTASNVKSRAKVISKETLNVHTKVKSASNVEFKADDINRKASHVESRNDAINRKASHVKSRNTDISRTSPNVKSRAKVISKETLNVHKKVKSASNVDFKADDINRKASHVDSRNEEINRKASKVGSRNAAIDRIASNVKSRVKIISKEALNVHMKVKSASNFHFKTEDINRKALTVESRSDVINKEASTAESRNDVTNRKCSTVESKNDGINRKVLKAESRNASVDRTASRDIASRVTSDIDYTVNVSKATSKVEWKFEHTSKQLPKTRSLHHRPSYYISKYVVPDGEDGYPVPVPPSKTKSEIYVPQDHLLVDQHVIEAGDSLLESFDVLIRFLLENLSSDVAKVRALYRWTISQKLPLTTKPGYRNIQTPLGFLYCIRQKLAYFPELFATLCRKAEIPCVIIHGIAKSVCYDVGDKVTRVKGKNSWNAVYLEGGWRLIHPFWAAHTVSGYQTGRWAVVESDQFHTGGLKPCVQTTNIPNDFYFLTDPDKFITRCFPEDPTWQLLHRPLSKTEFEELPFLQPAFYELKLAVISHFTCAIPAPNGRVEIKIGVPAGKSYLFGYKLHARRDLESEGEYGMMLLDRYVLQYIHDSTAVFELRFPVVGIFKLELHCKDPNRELPSDWICDYKIICSEIMPECEPLPMVPSIGWGPGTELETVGLDCLTHKTPIVSLDEQTITHIRFSSPKDKLIDVEAVMFTNHQSAEELQSHVTLEHEEDHVIVKLSPPGEGEYALQIFVKEANGDRKNVCNFLCQRTLALEDPESADIRSELINATENGDADELSHWIDKFVARNMEDRGDLSRAKKKLLVARLSRDIREALDRKDLDLLEKSLQSASDISLRRQLGDLAGQAEAMRSRLRRLKRLRHEVLAMDQKTISEIKSYTKPPPAVHAVMAATFLLLGNKETELKKWSKVQVLISKQGKESLKKRVEVFNMDSVSPAVLTRVHEILSRFDLETIQIASAGAATFYQWAISMAGESIGDDSVISPTTKL